VVRWRPQHVGVSGNGLGHRPGDPLLVLVFHKTGDILQHVWKCSVAPKPYDWAGEIGNCHRDLRAMSQSALFGVLLSYIEIRRHFPLSGPSFPNESLVSFKPVGMKSNLDASLRAVLAECYLR